MRVVISVGLICGFVLLGACGREEPVQHAYDQPFQAEIIDACMAYPQHAAFTKRNEGKKTAEPYCQCIYETAMEGLSEDEQKIAAFYILAQMGVDVDKRTDLHTENFDAIGAGASAVGKAADSCQLR